MQVATAVGESLAQEVVGIIGLEREREAEWSGLEHNASDYESFSLIRRDWERAKASTSDMEGTLKELWASVKEENEDAVSAYFKRIEQIAAEAAAAHVRLAAQAKKSFESLVKR